MNVQLCFPVKQRCWNPEDSYMEICVGCGCCSSDAKKRAIARYRTSVEHLEEQKKFNGWDENPEWRKKQEKNIRANIRWYKRRTYYYRMRLKKFGVELDVAEGGLNNG